MNISSLAPSKHFSHRSLYAIERRGLTLELKGDTADTLEALLFSGNKDEAERFNPYPIAKPHNDKLLDDALKRIIAHIDLKDTSVIQVTVKTTKSRLKGDSDPVMDIIDGIHSIYGFRLAVGGIRYDQYTDKHQLNISIASIPNFAQQTASITPEAAIKATKTKLPQLSEAEVIEYNAYVAESKALLDATIDALSVDGELNFYVADGQAFPHQAIQLNAILVMLFNVIENISLIEFNLVSNR